jgi:hypothetical protein
MEQNSFSETLWFKFKEKFEPWREHLRSKVSHRRMVSSGMLRRVALVRADVWEELSASFIRMTRIGELGTTLAVTNN